jgi:polyphosphate kinase
MPTFNHLKVAPFRIRNFFIELLEKEIELAKQGKEAWTILKLNSLVDKKIIKKLYEASQAGVKIKLIVRGICVLKSGIEGLSENIEAISIVDKYLEHSRVYVFNHGGEVKYYISSADWMQRNFDHRVEVACPIYDDEIKQELWNMLQIQLNDNSKARLLELDHLNDYRKTEDINLNRSQFQTYDYFKKKLNTEAKN